MPGTIHFSLHNNYSQDVIVNVLDLFGGGQRIAFSGPLNKDESADVQVFADSDGHGAASWAALNGPANSNPSINDGDTCELNS
jgi:hypothetical protein